MKFVTMGNSENKHDSKVEKNKGFDFFSRIILESDCTAISYRVALRNDDIPIGEQTVAQVTIFSLKSPLSR